jgi:hypothetical protein
MHFTVGVIIVGMVLCYFGVLFFKANLPDKPAIRVCEKRETENWFVRRTYTPIFKYGRPIQRMRHLLQNL